PTGSLYRIQRYWSISGGANAGNLTLNGTGSGTHPGDITNFNTITKGDTGTWTLTGSISDRGGTSVEVDDGTLVLTGANTYSGGTRLSAGTLVAGRSMRVCVFVPMVQVWVMSVSMTQWKMPVGMTVWLTNRVIRAMHMLMMSIVCVPVLVI